jgi:hypothetical protein
MRPDHFPEITTMRTNKSFILTAAAMLFALPAAGQQGAPASDTATTTTVVAKPAPAAPESTTAPKSLGWASPIELQNFRPLDQRGINVFETPKSDTLGYAGFKLSWGAAFTQQFQALDHSTTAGSRLVGGVEQNRLTEIGAGFNNAAANVYMGAQLAPGIRVALTSYLSSRHHNETWVKDGYLLIDKSPIDFLPLQVIMAFTTVKVGHFEVNYGDAHFRRSDNGNAIYNPFVGNLIMDAFTTEIGGEVLLRAGPYLAMGTITGGEIRGNVTNPDKRSMAFISKLGYDKQLNKDLRVRLTGSTFMQAKAISNTLYAGDRAGSRYFWVLENDAPTTTESANFRSGMINPGFGSKVKSYMINPFVKYQGLELFGTVEKASGRAATETTNRDVNQYAGEVIYRFLKGEKLFVAAKYNTVNGELAGVTSDWSVNRSQLAGGWFITPGLMLKGEYVTQKYNDFPALDIRNGGKFHGFMVEGVVAF